MTDEYGALVREARRRIADFREQLCQGPVRDGYVVDAENWETLADAVEQLEAEIMNWPTPNQEQAWGWIAVRVARRLTDRQITNLAGICVRWAGNEKDFSTTVIRAALATALAEVS